MRRILLTLSFDGTNYHGWQVQKNALSVQETVQNAIEKLFLKRLDLTGCSRTDAGVHANIYCCHFDTDSYLKPDNILRGLNANLPFDIAVKKCEEVQKDFHARYSCKAKEYLYKIHNSNIRDPFLQNYAYSFFKPIDTKRMKESAEKFLGRHDFAGFCSIKSDAGDTVREIFDVKVTREKDLVTFSITGDGFLYNMVRIITGTLLSIEAGKISPADLEDIIQSKDRKRCGKTAPAHGLYLNKLVY